MATVKRLHARGDGAARGAAAVAALLLALCLAGTAASRLQASEPPAGSPVALVHVEGAIGPAMSRFVEQALLSAARTGSAAVILQLDTPGGLDTAMRQIIQAVLASPVPVIGYVAPNGARAASAGTYLLYACALAAMAPATNLGAATPISLGGESQPESASDRKAVNDAVAYIRSLAQLQGRNADWAESAVRSAASLPAQQALEQHVIDLIAADVPTLLQRIDGRRVMAGGASVVLHTAGAPVREVAPGWRTRLLLFISYPTIAYGLLLGGIWGLVLEGTHPGMALPGVAGALSLLLGLYGLALLQVDFAGLALVGLGVALIVTEFFLPAYGSLGVGGLAALIIGSIMLFSGQGAALQAARPAIIGVALAGAVAIAAVAALAARARRAPPTTGPESMLGALVEVLSGANGQWLVRYGGELWQAHSAAPLAAGQSARIVRVSGLTLWVEALSPSASSPP